MKTVSSIALACLLLGGCTGTSETPAQAPAPSNSEVSPQPVPPTPSVKVPTQAATPAVQPVTEVRVPATVVKELSVSEQNSGLTQGIAQGVCTLIQGAAKGKGAPRFARSFGARWGHPTTVEKTSVDTQYQPVRPDDAWLSRGEFTQRLATLGGELQEVTRCKVKHYRFQLDTGLRQAWARSHFVLWGITKAGARLELRLDVQMDFVGTPWRLQALELLDGVRIERAEVAFQDVSRQVGIRQFRAEGTDRTIQNQVDAGSIETMGGLGVIDWNRDGRDDLISWVRQRTVQVFINDGEGGFRAIVNPIEPAHVGLALLYIDLSGDERPELVSSEVVGCENGTAWLGLYEHRPEGLVERPRALTFPAECAARDKMRFQHLNVDDVDGDGDLDLFVGGFRQDGQGGQRQNVFRATSGLPNLFFRNDGRFRFSERARPGGFAGTSFSYGATFHDVDGDGDRDLYVVNDYGANTLYENRGRARFKGIAKPPLTSNGQSMGVTVADLTGDGAWDLYISNMYSHAGNRIVPLAKGQFRAEEYAELLRLSQGNALYAATDAGGYEDQAQTLGLAEAGWAWGQAVFDPDNDGDWDVYVVNGNTSNRDARAPDY